MIARSLLALACTAALTVPSIADDAHHPGENAKPAPSEPAGKMPVLMSRMHDQMMQIHATSDPKERDRLMNEHMNTMHESMPMMQGMK